MRKKGVLLALRESMYFIDKNHGRFAGSFSVFCSLFGCFYFDSSNIRKEED